METVKSNTLGIGEAVLELIHQAVEQALAARQGNDSFTPFAIVQATSGTGRMIVLATETVDEALATARLIVAKGMHLDLVLAFDGFITDTSAGIPRTEAVHVEAYEHGQDHGVRFTQRYTPGSGQEPPRRVGNMMFGGPIPLPREEEYGPIVARYQSEREKAGEGTSAM